MFIVLASRGGAGVSFLNRCLIPVGFTCLSVSPTGGRIILACRDEKKANQARKDIILQSGNTDVHYRHLDLASLKSVRRFAQRINEGRSYGRVFYIFQAIQFSNKSTLCI